MALTESERRALLEIERQFHRQSAPPGDRPRAHRRPATRVLIAAVVLPAGLAAMLLGLLIDNGGGVALAAAAYAAVVGSAAVLADLFVRTRAARGGPDQLRPLLWTRKYLR